MQDPNKLVYHEIKDFTTFYFIMAGFFGFVIILTGLIVWFSFYKKPS